MLKETDKRVKLMNQLLAGIRVIKLYAWEAAQESLVSPISQYFYPTHVQAACQILRHTTVSCRSAQEFL